MGKGKAKETGKGRWMGGVNNCCYYYLQFVSEGGVWEGGIVFKFKLGGIVNAKRVPCMTPDPHSRKSEGGHACQRDEE